MDENTFIAQVKSLLYKGEKSEVTLQTPLKELVGWNLILAVSVIEMIQEEYLIEISDNELRRTHTLEELYHYIHSQRTDQ